MRIPLPVTGAGVLEHSFRGGHGWARIVPALEGGRILPAPRQFSQLGMSLQFLDVLGSELAVVWADGHESYYPLEFLRRSCPCAVCAGEPDLFGNMARGPAPQYGPASFELDGFDRVGHYGIALRWRDGHGYGIWTLDRLRELCSCSACRQS